MFLISLWLTLKELLSAIQNQFGTGLRVKRLIGLQLEQSGRWEEADKLYSKLLEADPANSVRYLNPSRS